MEVRQIRNLRAELTYVESMLDRIPTENVIDRLSLQGRRQQVIEELARLDDVQTDFEPTRLIFRGKPVIGDQGIMAEFGTKIVSLFNNTIESMGASSKQELGSRGVLPEVENYGVMITGVARGSFGFQLERASDQLILVNEADPVAAAVDRVKTIMEATLLTDDELAESLADTDPRVIKDIRVFLEELAENEATCTIEAKRREFSFDSVHQVQRSAARLLEDNVVQRAVTLSGKFIGYLPESRQAEFDVSETRVEDAEFLGELVGSVVKAKIHPSIEHAASINHSLENHRQITANAKRVGKSKPTFIITDAGLE